jgi:1,4-dihydroxy-2-naphthoate octaprenyltransferase
MAKRIYPENQMAKPSEIIRMLRAPFFSSILAPMFVGILIAFQITGEFNLLGALFVLIMGLGLHGATNVYNDIYDTLQGTDKVNLHRNDFSGGSGVIVENPDMLPKMVRLARGSLLIAFVATIGLMFVINRTLWPLLWGLFILSAFFSKYYTAAPIKLAYRGLGEVAVWFAFGPMAILVAAISQNVSFHPFVLAAMPTTGLSTASILMIGQMIDTDADRQSGKLGLAPRFGNKVARNAYIAIQISLVLNIALLAFVVLPGAWFVALAMLPYLVIFPKLFSIIAKNYNDPESLKMAAGMNVQIHLLFSILLVAGLMISAFF